MHTMYVVQYTLDSDELSVAINHNYNEMWTIIEILQFDFLTVRKCHSTR